MRSAGRIAPGLSLLALSATAGAAPCVASERDLLGAWRSRNGPFEQMELVTENGKQVFNSWLHDRPEVSGGSWTLAKCLLQITSASESATRDLEIISWSAFRMTLRERGERAVLTYRRIH